MSQTTNYEVNDKNAILDAVRASRVSQLFIEFLQQGGPKPHVVMRLKINPIKANGFSWPACRLAMDLFGGYTGVFHITPLRYSNASNAAHAAFEFKVKGSWTVENLIATINQPTFTLLEFTFTGGFKRPGDNTEYTDGCRDFISQFFIRLHQWNVVNWQVCNIDRGFFNSKNLKIVLGQTGFHEIIGYNYVTCDTMTNVTELPIARGAFSSFQRIITYDIGHNQLCRLPYYPSGLEYGDNGFREPDTEWSEWAWANEFGCNVRWRWKDGKEQYEYDREESSGKGKGKATAESSAEGTEVNQWPGDPSLPDPGYFVRDLKHYYQGSKVISGPYERPMNEWVYNEKKWSDTDRTLYWRYWDGSNFSYR